MIVDKETKRKVAAEDGYFTGFITEDIEPIVMMFLFLLVVALIVFRGVNKGIESSSKVIMPLLLLSVIGISVFALTISHTDADGVTRTGLEGLKIYVIPNIKGMTIGKLFTVFIDALGQLFFSLSIAMGAVGNVIGCVFFAMVLFAAITSAMSVMEAVVSSLMDWLNISRMKAGIIEGVIALVGGIVVCLGYNKFYFEIKLPNGSVAQILDIMDYISNNMLMPVVALSTCILVGWVLNPKLILNEVEKNGEKMGRKRLYMVMIKFVAPVFLLLLLMQTLGILKA